MFSNKQLVNIHSTPVFVEVQWCQNTTLVPQLESKV